MMFQNNKTSLLSKITKYFSTKVNSLDLIKSKFAFKKNKINLGIYSVFPPAQNGVASLTYYLTTELLKDKRFNIFAIPLNKRIEKSEFSDIYFASPENRNLDIVLFICPGEVFYKIISKVKSKKVIWQTVHDTLNQIVEKNIFNSIKNSNPDLVITLSKWGREVYLKGGIKNTKYVPAFVDPDIFKSSGKKGDFTVLYLGRLRFYKGIMPFLRSIKLVLEKRPEIKFLIHGFIDEDREKSHEITNLINKYKSDYKNNFIFNEGWVDYKNMKDLYGMASVLVLPSHSEGFGIPLIEAMSCGIPCIVTDKPPMNEIVLNNVTGFCLPMRGKIKERFEEMTSKTYYYKDCWDWALPEAEDIAQSIIKLKETPSLYESLSNASLKRAENYHKNTVIDKMKEILIKVSGKKNVVNY